MAVFTTQQYAVTDSVQAIKVGPYYGRRALQRTLRMMQSETGILVEGAILRRLQEQGFEVEPLRDNKSVYKPEAMFEALERYTVPYPEKPTDPCFHAAVDLAFRAFGRHGKYLKPLRDPKDLRRAVKLTKSSGAPEFVRKRDAFEKDLQRMKKIVDGVIAPPPCVCYHRVQHGEQGPKQRMVWGYPLSMTLVEAQYARPLIEKFLKMRTPMAFGLMRFQLAARALTITNSGLRYGLDFSKFDSSVPPWLIDIAFRILGTWFEECEKGPAWDTIVNYFIHTPIIMPDGNVYRKSKGVPSGSYFTQLVDSVVNYIVIQYAMLTIVGKPVQDHKILVLGDDSLFGLDRHISLDAVARVLKAIGFTLNVEKSDVSRFGEPWHFLGHVWVRGIVDRPVLDLVKRAIFPEKPVNIKDTRERIALRMIGLYCDARSAHVIYFAARRVYREQCISFPFITDYTARPVTDWQGLQVQEFGFALPKSTLDLATSGILM